MQNEIDCLMRVDQGGVVVKTGESDAWLARLEEWLRTPQGSVYGLPGWGNTMQDFKHEPVGSETGHLTEVAIEAALIKKLRIDLPGLGLRAISCAPQNVDTWQITFITSYGPLAVSMNKN
ncbi:MAG: hypothetical protein KIB40_12365 [Pantoea sp.]|uniref:Uncharacterized protein n=1 Tax=Pantoea brenneri TaxID=472694 RepID=A0AAX3JC15_9GAMM|nr:MULTISPECIES: hypothetical protein [Pantoea]MBS6033918.1 hypothetical protein [Pantoea sp.]VXC60821.1 conserved hypothetical protein [Pantoea brenneri]